MKTTNKTSGTREDGQASVNVDPPKTHVVRELKLDSPIISRCFDPTGRYVFFGGQDNRVWRWQWSDSEAKTELAGHDSWVRAIAFTPDGQSVVTGGYDGHVRISRMAEKT